MCTKFLDFFWGSNFLDLFVDLPQLILWGILSTLITVVFAQFPWKQIFISLFVFFCAILSLPFLRRYNYLPKEHLSAKKSKHSWKRPNMKKKYHLSSFFNIFAFFIVILHFGNSFAISRAHKGLIILLCLNCHVFGVRHLRLMTSAFCSIVILDALLPNIQ